MAAWCTLILTLWIWLLRYLYRTYNEFYVLLEQIYSGEYFKDQQNGDNSRSGNETPTTGMADDGGEVEAECIELDTFEQNDNDNDDNDDNDEDKSVDNSNADNDK